MRVLISLPFLVASLNGFQAVLGHSTSNSRHYALLFQKGITSKLTMAFAVTFRDRPVNLSLEEDPTKINSTSLLEDPGEPQSDP